MIISASRRTDIPAFFSDWFGQQWKQGYTIVSNPFNPKQRSKISLLKKDVDAFVFWTRFADPFLFVVKELEKQKIPFYFLFTITPYGRPLELFNPPFQKKIESFKKVVDIVGIHRVIWRYDPIIISNISNFSYHLEQFEYIASALRGYTTQVKISFFDGYKKAFKNIYRNIPEIRIQTDPSQLEEFPMFLHRMVEISKKNGMIITSCSEELLEGNKYIKAGSCIDVDLINRQFHLNLPYRKDPNQRFYCNCAVSKDIGVYNSCKFGCLYCYATTRHVEKKAPI